MMQKDMRVVSTLFVFVMLQAQAAHNSEIMKYLYTDLGCRGIITGNSGPEHLNVTTGTVKEIMGMR